MKWPSVWAGTTFGASPPLVTMPCTWFPGLRVLAEKPDGYLRDRDERPRRRFLCMGQRTPARGAPPGVADFNVIDRQALGNESVLGPRVDHHRRMHALEGSALEHENLPASALFCRGSRGP